jgi:nitrogen fixation NifU-like protein
MMDNEFEVFLQALQEHIFEETQRQFGEKVCARWKNPLYMGVMTDADATAEVQGRCGDSMQVFLKFEDDRVVDASFYTNGCGSTIVCGSYVAEMALGKTIEELLEITGDSILSAVGRLPDDHRHCAFLAANSLQAAADDYLVKQQRRRIPTGADASLRPELPS